MKLKVSLIIAFSLLVIGYFTFNLLAKKNLNDIYFRVKKGESTNSISQRLENNNIIFSSVFFKFYSRLTAIDRKLTSGLFHFDGKLSLLDITDHLIKNKVKLSKITIPEALTSNEIFTILENKGFGSVDNYQKLVSDSSFVKYVTKNYSNNIEGFLYPETYFIDEKSKEEDVIEIMTSMFFKLMPTLADSLPIEMSYYDYLTLASIVEEEAVHANEKSKIASVYLNRLKRNQKLEADPTVAYILRQKGKVRKKIYFKDLREKSPYNTYLNKGLPPSPICSPSKSALEAVLNPLETNYYFFFAGKDRYHIFSETYKQHNRRLQIYRKK